MIPDEPVVRNARWSKPVRIVVAVVPALVFIGLLAWGLARSGSKAVSGDEAPSFELPLLDGSGTLTDEDLRGSPVVVNFWASWCIPCREEAPVLEKAWRAYRDEGVVFLGVNIKDAEVSARGFVDDLGLTYLQVRDTDEGLARALGVKGLPETFFIDHRWAFIGGVSGDEAGQRDGTVVLGAISEDELIENVELLVRRAASE